MTEEQFTDEQGNIVTKKVSVEPLSWGETGGTGSLKGGGTQCTPASYCCPDEVGRLWPDTSVIRGNSGELRPSGPLWSGHGGGLVTSRLKSA